MLRHTGAVKLGFSEIRDPHLWMAIGMTIDYERNQVLKRYATLIYSKMVN